MTGITPTNELRLLYRATSDYSALVPRDVRS